MFFNSLLFLYKDLYCFCVYSSQFSIINLRVSFRLKNVFKGEKRICVYLLVGREHCGKQFFS